MLRIICPRNLKLAPAEFELILRALASGSLLQSSWKSVGSSRRHRRLVRTAIFLCTSSFAAALSSYTAWGCDPAFLKGAVTDRAKTHIRKGGGEWGAMRSGDVPHQGVDLVINASYPDQSSYAVNPIAGGRVAYARLNGALGSGYGNTIVVDHGNNCYSLYAHLASHPFTPVLPGGNLLREVGSSVTTSDILGYFVDIRADVDSTGNARVTAPEARLQLHFELIAAPSGRTGAGSLQGDILKMDSQRVDPTPILRQLGYQLR